MTLFVQFIIIPVIRMKICTLITVGLIITLFGCHADLDYEQIPNGVKTEISDGILYIFPLTEKAIRIKFCKEMEDDLRELIFTALPPVPYFEVSDTRSVLTLKTKEMQVLVNKKSGKLSFADASGAIFLEEIEGSRRIIPDTIQEEPCLFV